jgi:hypothetical protein
VTRLIGPAVVVLIASSASLGCGLRSTSDATVSIVATGLECVGEREQLLEYDLVAEERGAATEESAAAAVLSFYIDRHGGQRVMLRSNAYGMEIDGRTVVVADVTPAPAGGFWVTTVHVCDSFVPVETGPPETVTPVSSGPSSPVLMRVDEEIVAGQPFTVSFTGQLSEIRGGYLFVNDARGEGVALLRGDGNSEIPMGYELDPARWGMLDDGLSGASSTFVFPLELSAGVYALCTANSVPEQCVDVRVTAYHLHDQAKMGPWASTG